MQSSRFDCPLEVRRGWLLAGEQLDLERLPGPRRLCLLWWEREYSEDQQGLAGKPPLFATFYKVNREKLKAEEDDLGSLRSAVCPRAKVVPKYYLIRSVMTANCKIAAAGIYICVHGTCD